MGRQQKKQKHNAAAKSVDTGVESDPPGNVEITTNSADAGNANFVVASGGIDPVVKLKHMTMHATPSMLPSTTPAMVKSTQVTPWKQQQQLAIMTLMAQIPQA
jgi:hypothetical protein